MRLDRMTTKFQQALSDAQSLALGKDHQYIEPIHLMSALLNQDGTTVAPLLTEAGINVNSLRSGVSKALERLPVVQGSGADVQLSQSMGRVLNICDKMSQKRQDKFISSELFVLAVLEASDTLTKLLKENGATKETLEKTIEQFRGGKNVDDANAEDQRQALKKYTVDLTERAEQGKLDPVIGRDEEIRRTIQVLQRRTKNKPCVNRRAGCW